jgi:hypothetical protein
VEPIHGHLLPVAKCWLQADYLVAVWQLPLNKINALFSGEKSMPEALLANRRIKLITKPWPPE